LGSKGDTWKSEAPPLSRKDRHHPGSLSTRYPGNSRHLIDWDASRATTKLNEAIAGLASSRGIPVHAYSRDEVRNMFGYLGAPNKHTIAEAIAKHIPAFERYVPPPRKPWMSEDARMGLFDAAALALVFFQRAGGLQDQVQ
jgi:hypothetical protein